MQINVENFGIDINNLEIPDPDIKIDPDPIPGVSPEPEPEPESPTESSLKSFQQMFSQSNTDNTFDFQIAGDFYLNWLSQQEYPHRKYKCEYSGQDPHSVYPVMCMWHVFEKDTLCQGCKNFDQWQKMSNNVK